MKLRPFCQLPIIVTLIFLGTIQALADKTAFSGIWTLDKTQSVGIPKDMDQKMTIKIAGDMLELETDLFQGDNVTTVSDTYQLTGKEVDYNAHFQNGLATTGKRTAKWNDDGKGFEVQEAATFETADGKVMITMHRKWRLSEDGKTIQIELHHTGPNGPVTSKRTFTKK